MDPPYSYRPLNADLGEIRLLRIDGVKVGEQIRCTIKHFSMKRELKYVALSYTWDNPLGKADNTEEHGELVLINKSLFRSAKTLPIRYNLACALRTLPRGRSRWYWIDAICLEQSNIAERNEQVPRMGSIYSGASKVIVWLGPSSDNSDLAISFINKIAAQVAIDGWHEAGNWLKSTLLDEAYRDSWSAYISFSVRTWWRRAWVVQEVALAKVLEVWCGATRFDWEAMVKSILSLPSLDNDELFSHCRGKSEADLFILTIYAIHFQLTTRGSVRDGNENSSRLLHLLDRCRASSATNSRDKLFSVLSLVSRAERDLITTDYNMSVRNLYISFAKTYIETTGDLQIITLAHENLPASFPSWVPDWTQSPLIPPLSIKLLTGLDSAMEYCAHKSASGECHFSGDMQAITCRGVYFDDVNGLGAQTYTGIQPGVSQGTQSSTMKNAYGTTKQVFEAIWRSFCADSELLDGVYGNLGNFGTHFAKAWLNMSGAEEENGTRTPGPAPVYTRSFGDFSFLRLGGRTIQDFVLEAFKSSQGCEQPDIGEARWAKIARHGRAMTAERRFLITDQGYVGWAPRCTRKGDEIFVLFGCGTPVILRPHGDTFQLIGECYVHGIMYGKVIDDLEEGKYQLEDVTIV